MNETFKNADSQVRTNDEISHEQRYNTLDMRNWAIVAIMMWLIVIVILSIRVYQCVLISSCCPDDHAKSTRADRTVLESNSKNDNHTPIKSKHTRILGKIANQSKNATVADRIPEECSDKQSSARVNRLAFHSRPPSTQQQQPRQGVLAIRPNETAPLRFIFAIGINYTSDPNRTLLTCFRDIEQTVLWVENVQQWDIHGMPRDHVVWMTDAKERSPSLPAWKAVHPVKREFERAWTEWTQTIHQNVYQYPNRPVEILFCFSGHGRSTSQQSRRFRRGGNNGNGKIPGNAVVEQLFDEEIDGLDENMVLVDDQILDDQWRHTYLPMIPLKANMMCIIDACHSGSMMDLDHERSPSNPSAVESPFVNPTSARNRSMSHELCSIVAISGCADRQTSLAGETSRDCSVLTHHWTRNRQRIHKFSDVCSAWNTTAAQITSRYSQFPILAYSLRGEAFVWT